MAEMPDFGKMDILDRGGEHDFQYADESKAAPDPGITPSQTVGPFFAFGLTPGAYGYSLDEVHQTNLTQTSVSGDRITIVGQIFDGNGQAIHDAVIEIVQADGEGKYATNARNDGFTGYGRAGTGALEEIEGCGTPGYSFTTIKPGVTKEGNAPFLTVIITMRGLLNHCITRMYFPEGDLSIDPILNQVPSERRDTLVAEKLDTGHYRFNIHMQGKSETVFFDL